MKFNLLLFLLWSAQYATAIAAKINECKQMKYGNLNILIEDLESLNWGKDETLCLKQLLSIIKNVQNSTLWATWIWDSMQTPVGQLYGSRNNYGNYDECLDFPWEKVHPDMRTQYCLARVHLGDVESKLDHVDFFGNVKTYIRGKSKHNLEFNTLRWGICTPAVCNPQSVIKFVGALFRQTHLGLAVDEPIISVSKCDVAGDTEVNLDFGFYFSWSLLVSAVLSTILGTLFVYYKGLDSKSTGFMYAKAFHIPNNVESLVKITNNDLRSLFGIRVLSFYQIVFMHIWLLPKTLGISNAVQFDKDLEKPWVLSINNLEVVVDTFALLSGLLLVKSLMANRLKPINPVKVIVKRYCRLILPVIFLLLMSYKAVILPRSPVKMDFYDREFETCKQNWWKTILMVQNYFDSENMCYPVLWSVACDFHLTVLGTIGTWLFMRKRKLGLLIFLVGFIASIVLPAMATVSNPELALIPAAFQTLDNYRKYVIANPLYTATHFRAGSYFVGMAAGYLITLYNPVTHRNVISQKYSILGFGALLATFAGYFIIGYFMYIYDTNIFFLASYVSLKRIIWAVLMTTLVILCEYGTLPLVSDFLGWSALAPISRLSYGVYLSHVIVISVWRITTRSTMQYEFCHSVLLTLGVTSASCIISFFLWTFYEEPLRIIISDALTERNKTNSKEVKKQETKPQNGMK